MNLRNAITRTVKYSVVNLSVEGETSQHIVYGETNVREQVLKYLKEEPKSEIPNITVKVVTEKRAISLEDFLNNSIIITESEEV